MADFRNIVFDHVAYNLSRELYAVQYAVFGALFGEDSLVYEIPHEHPRVLPDGTFDSFTYAFKTGSDDPKESPNVKNSICAFIQPIDPKGHAWKMLDEHSTDAMIDHLAFRTSDLVQLHSYLYEHGVNFITPLMRGKDAGGDLLQVFAGEFYHPHGKPSGLFTEFLQRGPGVKGFFSDETFKGLYQAKDDEYEHGAVVPFIDHELFFEILDVLRKVGAREGRFTNGQFGLFEIMMSVRAQFKKK